MIELAMACNQATALAQYRRKTSRCALRADPGRDGAATSRPATV
jgi:hypothetical protein